MRSSDLFYGLLAAMAGFGAVVALAAGAGGAVVVGMVVVGVLGVVVMLSRARAAPQVLVVGRRDGRRVSGLLESELDTAGFAVASCAGPSSRPCPVLQARPCPIPAHPSATIAYVGERGEPLPPCERYFHVPTVAIDGGSGGELAGAARRVSWQDGPSAALGAVREVTHV
jgi:type IV secretory pathway TrbD component